MQPDHNLGHMDSDLMSRFFVNPDFGSFELKALSPFLNLEDSTFAKMEENWPYLADLHEMEFDRMIREFGNDDATIFTNYCDLQNIGRLADGSAPFPGTVTTPVRAACATGQALQADRKRLTELNQEAAETAEKLHQIRKQQKKLRDSVSGGHKRAAMTIARKRAKFRVGDVIRYSPRHSPILVTSLGCYESGEPYYNGLEVQNHTLTRNQRTTKGFGTQNPRVQGRDVKASEWVKVGDCSRL